MVRNTVRNCSICLVILKAYPIKRDSDFWTNGRMMDGTYQWSTGDQFLMHWEGSQPDVTGPYVELHMEGRLHPIAKLETVTDAVAASAVNMAFCERGNISTYHSIHIAQPCKAGTWSSSTCTNFNS